MADFETFGGLSDEARKALLARANGMPGIATANPFQDQNYAAKQQALAARLPGASGAERQFLLGNIHPGMLDQGGNIEKFQAFNRGENATGPINQDVSYSDPYWGNFTAYQRGQREYVPGLGITQSMGPRVEIGTGGGQFGNRSGGIWGALGRNEESLKRFGGALSGGALGLMTGNPILAAIMAAKGGYSGQAPSGLEVVGAFSSPFAKGALGQTARQIALEQLKRRQQGQSGVGIDRAGLLAIAALKNRMSQNKQVI